MTLYSLHDFRLTPSITVSESDNRQLTVLALAGSGHTTDAADDLLHELERARVVVACTVTLMSARPTTAVESWVGLGAFF